MWWCRAGATSALSLHAAPNLMQVLGMNGTSAGDTDERCLCTAANASQATRKPLACPGDPAEWEKVVHIHMLAAMRLTHALSRPMVRP